MRRFLPSFSIRGKGAAVLAIPTLMTLFSLLGWTVSRQQEETAARWVTHTEEVLKNSNELLTLLVDAETGVRGYGLTRDEQFLAPYIRAQRDIPVPLGKLERLTVDNASQQSILKIIRNATEDYLAQLAQIQQLLGASSLEQPLSLSTEVQRALSEGKANLDELRSSLEILSAEEEALLQERERQLSGTKRVIDRLLILSTLMILGSYAIALYLYNRADKELEARNQELSIANQSLSKLNAELTQKNQDLDDFTHTVSHDLKEPLRAVRNLSDWIVEDLALPADSKSAQHVVLMQDRIERMRSLIDHLLAYAKAGRTQEKKKTVNVSDLIAETVDSIGIPPEFKVVADDSLPTLQTEQLLLKQVFSNLISNSYKHHTDANGKVVISAEPAPDGRYRFIVQDDGPGIAPEYQKRIFNLFHTAKSDRPDSTGIGLSIVQKIVERKGGKLELASKPGEGSTFSFTWV